MTDNREKLISRNKGLFRQVMGTSFVIQQGRVQFGRTVELDSFIEKTEVRFFALISQESFGDQSFLKSFLCPGTIFCFAFCRVGLVGPFPLLNQTVIDQS